MSVYKWFFFHVSMISLQYVLKGISYVLVFKEMLMPTTAVELVHHFWRFALVFIPMVYINHLIHSMYRRCVAVINTNGEHTRCWLSFLVSSKSVMYCWQKYQKKYNFRNFLCLEIWLKWFLHIFIIEITIYFKIKLLDTLIIYATFLWRFSILLKEMLFSGLYITWYISSQY